MSTRAYLHVNAHSKATQSHKLLMYELAGYANTQGLAWASVATLAEATGYKRKWIEKVLDDLVRAGEMRREKHGRGYRYHLYVYDTETKTCTCAVTDHISQEDHGHGHARSGDGQLLPEHGHLLPEYGQSPDANLSHANGNPAEPVFDPGSTPEKEPGLTDVEHEEDKRHAIRTLIHGFLGTHDMPHASQAEAEVQAGKLAQLARARAAGLVV
jgi:hypothetical protein